MTEPQWETVDVPAGAFIGWGTSAGQHVTGKVLEFDPAGGLDFNDKVCPQLVVELTERAASFNKAGDRTDYDAGELVTLTCGLVRLSRAVKAAQPEPGDLVKVTMTGMERTANGEMKVFDLKIARGAGRSAQSAAQSAAQPAADPFAATAQPPF